MLEDFARASGISLGTFARQQGLNDSRLRWWKTRLGDWGGRWIAARTRLQFLGVGVLWVVLTVLFEIGLGRLVLGLPWERIAEDYDTSRGGFLAFGLMFMAMSPLLAARVRGGPRGLKRRD